MADIESLKFKLLIDNKEFDKQVKLAMDSAKKLNAELSALLGKMGSYNTLSKAQAEGIKAANQARREDIKTREFERRQIAMTEAAEERLAQVKRKGAQASRESANATMQSANSLRSVLPLLASYFSIVGAERIVRSLVQISGEFEMQKTTLRAILNDAQGADRLFEQMKELAVISPFQFKDLASYAKQLSAFSIPMENLYDTTKMLADVSAGLGVDMSRIVLAYGQIRSASFLRGQEVRQLTEAGIPILEELAKQFEVIEGRAVSVGEVFDKISSRQVPFAMVEKVFKNLTSEGGKFFEMQEVQAGTLQGKISNLKDAYQIMMSEIAGSGEGIKRVVDFVRSLLENYRSWATALSGVVAGLGMYKIAMVASTTAMRAASFWAKVVAHDLAALRTVTAGAAGVLLGIGVAIYSVVNNMGRLNREVNELVSNKFGDAERESANFERLASAVMDAAQGTQRRREAIEELNAKYGEYLPNLIREADDNEVVAQKIDGVTRSIYARAKAYAYEEGARRIASEFGKKSGDAQDDLIGYIMNAEDISRSVATEFVKGFKKRLTEMASAGEVIAPGSVFRDAFASFFERDFTGDMPVAVSRYYSALAKEMSEVARLQEKVDASFGDATYSTATEMMEVQRINDEYTKALAIEDKNLKDLSISQEEYNRRIKELDIKKLEDLRRLYASPIEGGMLWDPAKWREYDQKIEDAEKGVTGWQKTVDDVLQKYGVYGRGTGGIGTYYAEMSDAFLDYVATLRKGYKSLDQSIKDYTKSNPGEAQKLKTQKDAIEDIAKALGIDLQVSKGGSGKSAAQKAVEAQIESLKTLLKWYEKLKAAGVSDETAKGWLNAFFPGFEDIVGASSYKDALAGLADSLEKFDKDAAKTLREFLGSNSIDAEFDKWQKKNKADKDSQKALEDWILGGANDASTVNGALAKYKNALEKIAKKKADVTKDVDEAGDNLTDEERRNRLARIEALSGRDSVNALNVLNKDLKKIGADWVKNWATIENGFDIDNLSDMSEANLRALRDLISSVGVTQVLSDLDDETREAIGKTDEALDTYLSVVIEHLRALGLKVDKELGEYDVSTKFIQKMRYATDALADSFKTLGDALGSDGLTQAGETISQAYDLMKNLIKYQKDYREAETAKDKTLMGDLMTAMKGDILTTAVSLVMKFVSGILEAKAALAEARAEASALNAELALSAGVDTIFGENAVRKINNATNALARYEARAKEVTGWLTNQMIGDAFMKVPEWAKYLGYDSAYLADGMLNPEVLQAILDFNKGLNARDKTWLKGAITDIENYEKALEQLNGTISDVWSDLADTMADTLISAWEEVGDAGHNLAEDMDKTFSGVAKDIARKLISAFIQEDIIEKYRDDILELNKMMGNGSEEESIAKKFSEIAKGISADASLAAEFTNRLMGALQTYGVSFDESSSSVSKAISGITEDTASLLASYLNAIRADVSYSRSLLEAMGADMKVLLGLAPQTMSLEDYLTQIQANTYNNAVSAQTILEKLNSVISSEGGSPAFRAYVQ